jgi:hypothetical protein
MTKELEYYKTCVERSGDKLLTVSIGEGRQAMGGYFFNPYKINWPGSGDCNDIWHSIKGVGDAILKRYKALHINVSNRYMDPRILSTLFTGSTPNLCCVSFSYVDLDDHIVDWRQFLSSSPIKALGLGSKSALFWRTDYFKHVKLLDCYDKKNLRHLSSLSSLETLILRRTQFNDDIDIEMSLRLPHLRKLSLVGIWDTEILEAFELPALSCLTFISQEALNFSAALEVKPVELYWETLPTYKLPKISNELITSLGSVLNKYNTIKMMKVPSFMKQLVLDAFKTLANQGVVYVEILGLKVLDDDSVCLEVDILIGRPDSDYGFMPSYLPAMNSIIEPLF